MKTTRLNKRVLCQDGFGMSVQANEAAYCSPREWRGPYKQVEVGFPNQIEELLMPYCEDESDPCGTVYSYVPVKVVTLVLAKHGGMISGELPEGIPHLMARHES